MLEVQGKISDDLDHGRHDKCRACNTEDQARYEPREMRVLPDVKDRERPVDGDGNE